MLCRLSAVLVFALLMVFAAFPPGIAGAVYGGGTQEELYPQKLPADYLDALAQEKFEAELSERGETRRHTLRLAKTLQEMSCPVGRLICEVDLAKEIRYGGITPVNIRVYVDDVLYRKVVAYYELHVYDALLTAVHDLPVESTVKPADVRVQEQEVESGAKTYLTDWKQVGDRVPARIIRAGTAITENMLQNPLVLDVGSPVTIISNYNGVEIRTEGIAMQRGRVGKVIRVRNARSAKVLRCRVLDAANVEVLQK